MAHHKSAEKRARQAEKRRRRNVAQRTRIKTFTKRTLEELKKKDMEKAKESLTKLISTLDKAVKKGIIHKNTAARKKSRMSKKFNALLLETRTAS